jgi:GTPase SAR1 family protein
MQTREVRLPGGGKTLNLQLWDTAGQEQFAALTASFFRNAHAVVLAYDVHAPSSFAALQRWMMEVDRHARACTHAADETRPRAT